MCETDQIRGIYFIWGEVDYRADQQAPAYPLGGATQKQVLPFHLVRIGLNTGYTVQTGEREHQYW